MDRIYALLCIVAMLIACAHAAAPTPPHILFFVADDLGYNDLGFMNNQKTHTPTIDALRAESIVLDAYYAFKICSPSRASMLTGRYPWGAGFYDMTNDFEHETLNFTLWPEALQAAGYKTTGVGKWDQGGIIRSSTPTYRGFDSFMGYYTAALNDYWSHASNQCKPGNVSDVTDFFDNVGTVIAPANASYNGSYSEHLFRDRAVQRIQEYAASKRTGPFMLYFGSEDIHAAGPEYSRNVSIQVAVQAPAATVYAFTNRTVLDTNKLTAAMLAELDGALNGVLQALKDADMYNNTLVVFVSDNGGPLEQSTNAPLRGGKHTFYEGGVRVVGFIGGGVIPPVRQGTRWGGMMHASDWYPTLLHVAGVPLPPNKKGARPLDGFDMWDAIMTGGPSPRTQVIHQVSSPYFTEGVDAIRDGDWKLIRGPPGDNRTIAWPDPSPVDVPFGLTGGVVLHGHQASAPLLKSQPGGNCTPWCLFNVSGDIGETIDYYGKGAVYDKIAANLGAILDAAGAGGPPNSWTYGDNSTGNAAYVATNKKLCAQSRLPGQAGTLQPVDF